MEGSICVGGRSLGLMFSWSFRWLLVLSGLGGRRRLIPSSVLISRSYMNDLHISELCRRLWTLKAASRRNCSLSVDGCEDVLFQVVTNVCKRQNHILLLLLLCFVPVREPPAYINRAKARAQAGALVPYSSELDFILHLPVNSVTIVQRLSVLEEAMETMNFEG